MSGPAPYDYIAPEDVESLAGLFRERVRRSPEACAYMFFDALNGVWTEYSWRDVERDVQRWQRALAAEDLRPGDRVAIMARNSRVWVAFDQAALAMGLVTVPLYMEDRAENVEYIVNDAGVKLLVLGGAPQWERLSPRLSKARPLKRVVSIAPMDEVTDKRIRILRDWLGRGRGDATPPPVSAESLATIVYTSGTTGRPKGVVLSHGNILANTRACLEVVPVSADEVFLSFLPLSHTLERTVGYYLPIMAGACVAHARSIPELGKDLQDVRPTGLISVPRIYERVYARIRDRLAEQSPVFRHLFDLAVAAGWNRFEVAQGRARRRPAWFLWPVLKRLVADKITERLGGRLKVAISGGAALSPEIARIFIGLGVPILQGYGLTEASPVISVNRPEDNVPASIGPPLPGLEVRIGPDDELQVRGESIMMGYWNNPEATAQVLDDDGWLHTGDKARLEEGRLYITGRIKEIIVLANGEKVSPADMEIAIAHDPLFEQVMIVGEGRPFLSAIAVLSGAQWHKFAGQHDLAGLDVNDERVEKKLLERVAKCLHAFPGYAQVYRLTCTDDPWTVENGLMTPTMKLKRGEVGARHEQDIERMYAGHTN